ncbi:MAG: methylated-DNA--[protein]-cysteine S-methyltransferase [Candidatus Edwardsbacteria bacterium]|nr:methylated-DNA--[protein]-cysteine S-methyltransferase [Candidatus Edwardsbacteria bacterium]
MKIYYCQYHLPLGKVFVSSTDIGLFSVILGEPALEGHFKELEGRFQCRFIQGPGRFEDIYVDLAGYFSGIQTDFSYPLDLRGITPFEREVWNKVRQIPYGQVRSYKWLADQIHHPKAFKAVGRALGLNPLPVIIPCHRVIMQDLSSGGFSAGVGWKERLLRLERGELSLL